MKLSHAIVSLVLFYNCNAEAGVPAYQDESLPLDVRVEDAISRMTLNEKVAMCHAQGKFSSPGVPRLGIPDLWMSDGPHGVRAEINWNDWGSSNRTNDSITAFPALTALAATWNPELAGMYGNALGEEALYREKDVMLGPGVNIYRTPMNGRNFEYLGEDPYLASVMVVPYIKEMQKNGVAACVKHYALNNQELWRDHIDVYLSDRALYEIYLPAFKAAIVDGGAWSIMGAYNKVRGQHACHSELLLNDILKKEWHFDGVVITDWGGAHDTREAALNGLDLEMGTYTNGLTTESNVSTDYYYLADPYKELLKTGELPMSTLDDKVRRLLRLNFRTAANRDKPYGSIASPEHYAVAELIGNESIVLLKNSPASKTKTQLLPLKPDSDGRILVVGENAVRDLTAGGGSSELKSKDVVSPLEGLKSIYRNRIEFVEGYRSGASIYGHVEEIPTTVTDSLRTEAIAKAKESDVVIIVGGLNKNHQQDCEAGDRITYGLPFGQPELIEGIAEVNPNVIVVLLSGNAVEMPWIDKIPAIVQGWYLGSMGGKSIANVLSGNVNPSGKLPFSFPERLEDNAAHHYGEMSYPGNSQSQEYLEDIFVGYRWHDTKKIPALFPFGYGLSYTTFEYGKPTVSAKEMSGDGTITITIPVTNTGDVEGKEIVQLYIQDEKSSLPRPLKELKGFKKVNVSPGHTTDVTFTITPDDLKFFDDTKHEWIVESGKFKAIIGASSTDIRSTVQFSYK